MEVAILLKHPEKISATAKEIQNLNVIIENYFCFIEKESVFWDWMVSSLQDLIHSIFEQNNEGL